MADTFRILAQIYPDSRVLATAFTAVKASVISSVVACNQSTEETTIRISVAKNGEADASKQYLYYELPVPKNDSFTYTIGETLAIGDQIRVQSANGRVSFNVFGVEVV